MSNKESKKVKVLIIAPSMREIGGQSVQARRLLDAFQGDTEIEMEFLPNNPENLLQNIKYLRTLLTSLKFWWMLLTRIYRFDLVHVFSAGGTGYLISTLPPLFVSKIYGVKVVLNYHSGELENHLKSWRLALPTMRMFDQTVVPSQFLVDVFAKQGIAARAIFNFVDTTEFRFRERENLNPIFLSNRNFEAHYNVGDILRAFQIIQNRVPQARLYIAGYGAEEAKLKQLARDLMLEAVEFTGRIPNAEMARLYDKTDIYLNTSLVDNMPLSFIEAFAAGTPVVSYATGGITYLIEDGATGLMVAPKDYENLAEKAVFLLENADAAKKIIAKARGEVVKYSWENVRSSWIEFYLKSQSDR